MRVLPVPAARLNKIRFIENKLTSEKGPSRPGAEILYAIMRK